MYAAFHLPDFPLQARLRLSQNTSGPHALLDGEGRKAVITALNSAARSSGLEVGLAMPLALARCPNLVFISRSENAEREATALLRAAAWTMSPFIEDSAPGLVTAQLAELPAERHQPLGQNALGMLNSSGLHAQLGLAVTPLAALIAARYATPFLIVDRLTEFLDPLPLSVLTPEKELANVLALWGIRTLGQFRAIPVADVTRRLGEPGLKLWQSARGGTTRPLDLVPPLAEYTASLDCETPVETLDPLLFLIHRLIDRLIAELRAKHLAADTLILTLHFEDDRTSDREFRLPEPTATPDTLFKVLLSHLQTLRAPAPIIALNLRITPTRPLTRQHGLFDSALRDTHEFNETLARLAAAIGPGLIGTPAQSTTHLPDNAPLIPPALSVTPESNDYAPPLCGLPLRRYRPPHSARIEILDTVPVYISSIPACGAICDRRGPWLSSGNWWQPERAWRREEWDVELEQGGLYRLLRIGEDWFVEGEYD